MKSFLISKEGEIKHKIDKQQVDIYLSASLNESGRSLSTKFKDLNKDLKIIKELEGSGSLGIFEFQAKRPKTTNQSFHEYLGWDKEKVMALFGDSNGEPLKLYEHQFEALELLKNPNLERLVLILASGMASGKTEVAVLFLLKFFKMLFDKSKKQLQAGGYALVVYPTIELLRNQYSRWKLYFNGAYDLGYLPYQVDVAMIYGSQRKKELKSEREKIKNSPCVVLTTASTLIGWANNLKSTLKTIPYAIVLDEIHFYTTFDLSLLIELLSFLINRQEGLHRILMFSATVGGLEDFAKNIKRYLNIKTHYIRGESLQGQKTIYSIDISNREEKEQESIIKSILTEYNRKGFDDKTIIFARDRTEAESIRKIIGKDFVKNSCLHLGDMDEWERSKAIKDFMSGKRKIMITVKTLEVGIDIGDASRIIHLGLPPSLNDFMQREGRVGRRGQECESLVILRNPLEVQNFNEWIKRMDQGWDRLEEQMAKLVFNPDCELIKLLKNKVIKENRFPKEIEIGGYKIPCKVYGGLKKIPVIFNKFNKKMKHVWIKDVIFRYLPYSIRIWNEKPYIVKEIRLEQKERGGLKMSVIMDEINKDEEDRVEERVHRTSSYVETHIHPTSREEHPYQTIIVDYEPIETHHIGRKEKLVFDPKSGERKNIPYYYLIKSFPVQDDKIKKVLKEWSREFTRGFKLNLKIPSKIADIVLNSLELEPKLSIDSMVRLINISFELYIHAAVHLLLNRIVEKERYNPIELDHFIITRIDLDEKLKSDLKEILSNQSDEKDKHKRIIESILPKVSCTIVMGNKADLLKSYDFNSIKLEGIENLKEQEFKSTLLFPRCPIRPDLLDYDLLDRKLIINLTKLLLDELKDASNKIKTY